MNILKTLSARPTQDGDGVNISRLADFSGINFDPYLMIDELKSSNENDFIGGFPAHPHRGIETFTYMIKGSFKHQDQLGNKEIISAGNVQWMSTGYGVVHSEMPIADEQGAMHGFQIWLNMPAKDKMRPAQYQDSTTLPSIHNETGANLKLLAGKWHFNGETVTSPLMGLTAQAAIADLTLQAGGTATLDLSHHEQVLVYVHTGALSSPILKTGQLAIVDATEILSLTGGTQGAGALILTGHKIREQIVHMGPFVMNTQSEIRQAIDDYRQGKFGKIP